MDPLMDKPDVDVGMRVVVTDYVGRRLGHREVEGSVKYISRFGWATVVLDLGYQEIFWMNEIKPIDYGTLEKGDYDDA